MGIRLRLTLWSLLINGLVLLIGGFLLFGFFERQLVGVLDKALTSQGETLTEGVAGYFKREFHDRKISLTEPQIERALNSEDFKSEMNDLFDSKPDFPPPFQTMAALLDIRGQVILATISANYLDPPTPEALKALQKGAVHSSVAVTESGTDTKQSLRVISIPVKIEKKVSAYVQVFSPMQALQATMGQVNLLFALALPVLLLINGLLVALSLKSAFLPVRGLVETINGISERSLSLRVPIPQPKDEIRLLAVTFNSMIERLDRGFRFQERLFQDLSHQLKTPLAVLRGTLETVLVKSRSSEEYEKVLESNLEEVDRMTRLIESLLMLARLDSKTIQLKTQPIELETFCRKIVDDFSLLLSPKALSVSWKSAGSFFVEVDRERLRQAILNIFDNAIKYSPQNGTITFRFFRKEKRGGFEIVNEGPPIAPGAHERIFERFERLDSEERSGFGLGLSIARSTVEIHNGTLTAFDPVQGGAGFRLELPAKIRII